MALFDTTMMIGVRSSVHTDGRIWMPLAI